MLRGTAFCMKLARRNYNQKSSILSAGGSQEDSYLPPKKFKRKSTQIERVFIKVRLAIIFRSSWFCHLVVSKTFKKHKFIQKPHLHHSHSLA
jgi:hypothetical protein